MTLHEAQKRPAPRVLPMLDDVDLSGLADGDTLVWDATAQLWKPGAGGGGGTSPASLSRLSATNFAPTSLTAGSWHQLVFDSIEEQVGTDLSLDTSTGAITVNTDGIYAVGAQIQLSSAPFNTFAVLDILVSGAALDASMRNGQNVSLNADFSPAVSDHWPPYFIGAGEIIRVFAAVTYPSGGPSTPDYTTVWVQRVA